jgi:hypothetical protein
LSKKTSPLPCVTLGYICECCFASARQTGVGYTASSMLCICELTMVQEEGGDYAAEMVCWARLPRLNTLVRVRPERLMAVPWAAPALATAGAVVAAAADAAGTTPACPPNAPVAPAAAAAAEAVAPTAPRVSEVSRDVPCAVAAATEVEEDAVTCQHQDVHQLYVANADLQDSAGF